MSKVSRGKGHLLQPRGDASATGHEMLDMRCMCATCGTCRCTRHPARMNARGDEYRHACRCAPHLAHVYLSTQLCLQIHSSPRGYSSISTSFCSSSCSVHCRGFLHSLPMSCFVVLLQLKKMEQQGLRVRERKRRSVRQTARAGDGMYITIPFLFILPRPCIDQCVLLPCVCGVSAYSLYFKGNLICASILRLSKVYSTPHKFNT